MKKLPIIPVLIAAFILSFSAEALAVTGNVHILLGTFTKGTLNGSSMTVKQTKGNPVTISGAQNVTVKSGKLHIGTRSFTMPVSVIASQPMSWNGSKYYGDITFASAGKNSFRVGSRLDIELYLRGVLRAEMSPSWPMEALKAQAVIARTYAMRSIGKHKPYDLCATTHCQVYKGLSADDTRLAQAVNATKGQVLRHGGQPAATFFHSDSGGMVTRSGTVWGSDFPYLQPRVEPVKYTSPNTTWEKTLQMSQIQSQLSKNGVKVGTIKSITPVRRDESGRVHQIEIVGTAGKKTITGAQFRTYMGANEIKSTLFEIGTRSAYNPAVTTGQTPTPVVQTPKPKPAPAKVTAAQSGQKVDLDISQMPKQKDEQLIWMTKNKVFTTQELMEMLSKPELKDQYIEIGKSRLKGTMPTPVKGSALQQPQSLPTQTGTITTGYSTSAYNTPKLSNAAGTGAKVTFYGRGWGHGVGMSQWGAKALAENNWNYTQILAHYFPGTHLGQ